MALIAPTPKLQFFDANGVPLSGGKLYTYEAGTTTPLTTYTSSTGGTPNTNPVILDSRGEASVWLGTSVYKLKLTTSTDVEIWTVDNVAGAATLASLTASTGSSVINYNQGGTGAVTRSIQSRLRDTVSVFDFMTPAQIADVQANTALIDVRAACQAAIDAVLAAGGGEVFFPEGTYLLNGVSGSDTKKNGLLIPFQSPNGSANRIRLVGASRSTVLKAGNTDMYIVRFSDNHGGIENMTLDAESSPGSLTPLSGVTGLGVVPESVTQTTSVVWQMFNYFSNLYIRYCQEGIELKCGPTVTGSDSGCYYNKFSTMHIFGCTRGIWLREANTTPGSSVNRNYFDQIRLGQPAMNTGLQIDSGTQNSFVQMDFEGIYTGTSPTATPTGIVTKASGSGFDNSSNKFVAVSMENVTKSLTNAALYSEFYGVDFPTPWTATLTANPFIMFGGVYNPQFVPGYTYQLNSEIAGKVNGALALNYGMIQFPTSPTASTDSYVLDAYREGTWTPTFASVGGTVSVTYTNQKGYYVKIGRQVWVSCDVEVSAVTTKTGTALYIDMSSLPFTPGGNPLPLIPLTVIAENLSSPTASTIQIGEIFPGETRIYLRSQGASVNTATAPSVLQSNVYFRVSGFFVTDS